MLTFILALALGTVTLLSVSLQKTYSSITRKELKRRAAAGDEMAQGLYKAVAYGMSLRLLLWMITGASAASFFVVIADILPSWLAIIVSIGLLWFGFAYLPNSRTSTTGTKLAKLVSPTLSWALNHLYPLFSRISDWLTRKGRLSQHSRLYERDDLLELLRRQQKQVDNRISDQELRIATGALTFSDTLISQIMTPRSAVKSVSVSDDIGPVLMSELHDSGHSRFPVYQDKLDNLVGTLYLRDLMDVKAGGTVRDHMNKKVYYVHDEQSLDHALQAFLKTHHHLFIVVNNFEEFVGVVSIEDVLEQIIGKPIIDEFDKYDDLRAVAQLNADSLHKKEKDNHPK